MSLILPSPAPAWSPIGQYLVKAGDKPKATYSLKGRLYRSKTGWILLSVPNSLIRGAFDALDEPGVELPFQGDGTLRAHVSVIRPDELEQVPGGADAISERGHTFSYNLGRVKTVAPAGWAGMSRVWLIEIRSPELEKLRKSYGLTPKPKDNQFEFHITVAVRRKKILQSNPISKAAIARFNDFTRTKTREGRRISPFFRSFAKVAKKKKKKQPAGYLRESEQIRKNQVGKGSGPHKFVPAEWTHPNCHPRCLLCGGEERTDGRCEGHAAFLQSKQAAHTLGKPDEKTAGLPTKQAQGSPRLNPRDVFKSTPWHTLIGAGAGGLLGSGIGSYRAWRAKKKVLPAAVIGGLGGTAIGGAAGFASGFTSDFVRQVIKQIKTTKEKGPTRRFQTTLRKAIEPDYAGAPGGLNEAVRLSQKHMPAGKRWGLQTWAPSELDRPVNVKLVDVPHFGMKGGAGHVIARTNAYSGNVEVAAPGFKMTPKIRRVLSHELRHSSLGRERTPFLRGLRYWMGKFRKSPVPYRVHPRPRDVPVFSPQTIGKPGKTLSLQLTKPLTREYWKYLTSREELKAWLGEIRQQYVAATHRQIDTPEEAEKALRWWLGQGTDTPQARGSFRAMLKHPEEKAVLLQQLLQTVQNMPGMRDGSKLAKAGLFTKQALSVMGIPSRSEYGDLSKLEPGQLLDLIIQSHAAQRAGHHYDVRFGSPKHGLFSWAARKEMPEPGGRVAAFRQPLHSHAYGAFQGILPSGYGAGVVRTHKKGQILVTKVEPNRIHFTTAHQRYPERFILLRPRASLGARKRQWLLINTTPREVLPYEKVHYTKVPAEEVETHLRNLQEGSSVQAKIDGAASLVKLLKDGVEVVSYRQSKTTGRPIVHTERVFHARPQLKIPPELVGTILKGEIHGVQKPITIQRGLQDVRRQPEAVGTESVVQTNKGDEQRDVPGVRPSVAAEAPIQRSIPPQELGGLLNAAIARSLEEQRKRGIRLRTMLYDVQQIGKTRIDPGEVPYAKRREWLAKVLQHLPAETFHLPTEAKDPEAAQQLWESIRSGQEPTTGEGIVIHPATGKPMKAKLLEEQDVHITGTFPGEGKYKGVGAGGFTYGLEPGGPTIGRVGTGFSDELRRELFAHPQEFVGRIARVRSQGAFPKTRALRAPALLALHEDV